MFMPRATIIIINTQGVNDVIVNFKRGVKDQARN